MILADEYVPALTPSGYVVVDLRTMAVGLSDPTSSATIPRKRRTAISFPHGADVPAEMFDLIESNLSNSVEGMLVVCPSRAVMHSIATALYASHVTFVLDETGLTPVDQTEAAY